MSDWHPALDIKKMADARAAFYGKHIRSKHNEWILQELEEWADEIKHAAYTAWKNGVINQDEFQGISSAALTAWEELAEKIKEYEEGFDYVERLCGHLD